MNFRNVACVLVCAWWASVSGSTSVQVAGVSFDRTTSVSNGELFVAQSIVPENQLYGIARMSVSFMQNGSHQSKIVGLTPEKVCVNNATRPNKNKQPERLVVVSDNPLRGQCIGILSTYQKYPLVGFAPADAPIHSIAIVTDLETGRGILQNTTSFGDALGAVTQNIVQLAGGVAIRQSYNPNIPSSVFEFVFAAVTPSDSSDFTGAAGCGIGIAQLTKDAETQYYSGITPIDASGRNGGPQAAPLTSEMMQVGDTEIAMSSVNALCWNETLNKLYVGLTVDGGVAVGVGSVTIQAMAEANGKIVPNIFFNIKPCISDANGLNLAANWTDSTHDFIVAQASNDTAVLALDVMNASTGTNYLVVRRTGVEVYAVPLTIDGLLATKTDSAVAATVGSTTQLLTVTDARAVVGAGDAPGTITALHVYGDSVCISCAGDSDETTGIFMSQALFDVSGIIRGWSPWAPMAAIGSTVYDFSRDNCSRMKYLSGEQDTFYFQLWGQAYQNNFWGGSSSDVSFGLVNQINQFFPAQNGGVQGVFPITKQSDAAWYNTSPSLDAISLLMFTGRDRCALARTSADGTVISGSNFGSASNFWTYDFASHGQSLGMITSAAVSNSSSDAEGWIFVGGSTGVAVFHTDDGAGWTSLSDLSAMTADFSSTVLKKSDGSDFSQVTQILTDAENFYIICADGMYKCSYDSDHFLAGAAHEVLIASPEALLGVSYETIFSAVIVGEYAFLATSNGLWVNDGNLSAVTNSTGTGGWKMVPLTAGTSESFGVCSQLFFVPSSTVDTGGMLYVLTADVALNVASVYRVNVPSGASGGIDSEIRFAMGATVHVLGTTGRSYMTLLGQFREYFYTDGGMAFDVSSKHHVFTEEGTGMFRILPVTQNIGQIDAWAASVQPVFDIGLVTNTLSGVVCDVATGTLIVPGVWGVQILQ